MNKTYAQIVKQIETLKLEAEKLRRTEVEGVVTRIRDAIKAYDLTAADLGLSNKLGRKPKSLAGLASPFGKRKGANSRKAPAAPKYRNETGGTWGGIGKRPQWLRDALANGKQLSDFAVK